VRYNWTATYYLYELQASNTVAWLGSYQRLDEEARF